MTPRQRTGGNADGTPSRPVEIELKYRLDTIAAGEHYLGAADVAGFRAASPTRTTQLEDRYVDTADGALARSGFAARLRVAPNGTLVTVKSTARRVGDHGPHRREELEGPADRTAGPRDWQPSDARSLILELCGDAPLVELVTIRQLRRRRELRDADSVVELSLDEVDVVARSQVVERFAELEVELLRGAEAGLLAIGETLDRDPKLDPSSGSKLETALAAVHAHVRRHGPLPDLAGGRKGSTPAPATNGHEVVQPTEPAGIAAEEPAEAGTREPGAAVEPAAVEPGAAVEPAVPSDAGGQAHTEPEGAAPSSDGHLAAGKTPGIVANDSIAEAGRKVLRFHLARMITREAGTRDGKDPEDLHSMRVATRRMRAAWRVFGDGFRPKRTGRYRRHLRTVAARLGAVRDLDVLLEAADAYRAALPKVEQRALEPLLNAWRGYREDARGLLIRELDSPGYQAFVEDFRVFVVTEGAGARDVIATEAHRIRDTAPSRIWQSYEQVRAYEPVLRWADTETLHDLRIAAKWLRYTIEFVREALGPEAADVIPRVVALQDHLGYLHDADVSASMARTFLVEHASSLSERESAAIGRYLVSREREAARLKRTVGPAWRGVAGISFRRRLARAVAAL